MSNSLEAIWNSIMVSIDHVDEPKHPLHTGEVTNCWIYYNGMKEFIKYEEMGLNTTTDDEVREMLIDAIKVCSSQVKKLEEFMFQEGIPLPDSPAKKPKADSDEIPLGVKFTDDEITNAVSIKIAGAIIECATGEAQAVRNDLGLMWFKFHSELFTFGATLKTLMIKRGWIRIPPYYYPPGKP